MDAVDQEFHVVGSSRLCLQYAFKYSGSIFVIVPDNVIIANARGFVKRTTKAAPNNRGSLCLNENNQMLLNKCYWNWN
jgi:hypothetical protein